MTKAKKRFFLFLFFAFLLPLAGWCQGGFERCGTDDYRRATLATAGRLRQAVLAREKRFDAYVQRLQTAGSPPSRVASFFTLPVVFHVVLPDPAAVTDAQIQQQLDLLNRCFAGRNGDSASLPGYFRPLVGRSQLQFCLAAQTPEGRPTTGIVRTASPVSSFSLDDAVKHASTGGDDAWNTERYFNVWVCRGGNFTGYATFPDAGGPAEQGVVIDERTLPGTGQAGFGNGKTLVHETGHCFALHHIWGDGGPPCAGTDFVDDTPPQSGPTLRCPTGVVTDACTPGGPGILYQNYMDYTDDDCKVMFTKGQVLRMEAALAFYYPSLPASPGCSPPLQRNLDLSVEALSALPPQICVPVTAPTLVVRNRGRQLIRSFHVALKKDNGPATVSSWSGSLGSLQTAVITLSNFTPLPGRHRLALWVADPNGGPDENTADDTLYRTYQWSEPVTAVEEGFEGPLFPPDGWAIDNPDNAKTWTRIEGVGHSGLASVVVKNLFYAEKGQADDLTLPLLNLAAGSGNAVLSFSVAAGRSVNVNAVTDTLAVLLSTDCGLHYRVLYKRGGNALTTQTSFPPAGTLFVPSASEWRRDSVDLSAFLGNVPVLLAFRNTNGQGNAVYLDDVAVRRALAGSQSESTFSVLPNPVGENLTVRYRGSTLRIRELRIVDATGQTLKKIPLFLPAGPFDRTLDVSALPPGTYLLVAEGNEALPAARFIKF